MVWADDAEHDKCFLELYYKERFVVAVSNAGNGRYMLEFPKMIADEGRVLRSIEMSVFMEMIELAQKAWQAE